jgi:LysM repeat protein
MNYLWLVGMLLTLLALAACVRPYPSAEPAEEPLGDAVATTQPVLPAETTPALPAATIEGQPTAELAAPTVEVLPTEAPVSTTHVVQAGETLFLIGVQYGVSVEEIAAANNLTDVNRLEVGQQLIIPAPGSVDVAATAAPVVEATPLATVVAPTAAAPTAGGTHVVQAGENLFRIGLSYGCTVEQLAAANDLADPTRIDVGQVLVIPDCS